MTAPPLQLNNTRSNSIHTQHNTQYTLFFNYVQQNNFFDSPFTHIFLLTVYISREKYSIFFRWL